jgi:hypothetical protein
MGANKKIDLTHCIGIYTNIQGIRGLKVMFIIY